MSWRALAAEEDAESAYDDRTIGISRPREVVRVERDYTGGEIPQFWSGWIWELEGRVRPPSGSGRRGLTLLCCADYADRVSKHSQRAQRGSGIGERPSQVMLRQLLCDLDALHQPSSPQQSLRASASLSQSFQVKTHILPFAGDEEVRTHPRTREPRRPQPLWPQHSLPS